MAQKVIDEIVDQVALEQLEALKRELSAVRVEFDGTLSKVKEFKTALQSGKGGYEAVKTTRDLAKANKELAVSADEVIKKNKAKEISEQRLANLRAQQAKIEAQTAVANARIAKIEEDQAIKTAAVKAKAARDEEAALKKLNAEKAKAAAQAGSLKNRPIESIPFTINDGSSPVPELTPELKAQAQAELEAAQAAGQHRVQIEQMRAAQQQAAAATQLNVAETEDWSLTLNDVTGSLADNEARLAQNKKELDALNLAKKRNGSLTAEQLGQERALKLEATELNRVIGIQRTQLEAAEGSLIQMNAQLKLLQAAYERLSVTDRNSQFGQNLQKEITSLNASIVQQEVIIGRNTKVVGTYTSSIQKAFSGAFSGIRQLAYLIPGLGMAGIIGAISEGFVYLFDVIKNGTNDSVKELKALKEATSQQYQQAGQQIARLQVLNEVLKSNAASAKQKKAAYDEIIEQYPNVANALHDEYVRTGNVANVIMTKLIPALIAAAQARAYEQRITEIQKQRIEQEDIQIEQAQKRNKEYQLLAKNAKQLGLSEAEVFARRERERSLQQSSTMTMDGASVNPQAVGALNFSGVNQIDAQLRITETKIQAFDKKMQDYAVRAAGKQIEAVDAEKEKKEKKTSNAAGIRQQKAIDRMTERERKAQEALISFRNAATIEAMEQIFQATGSETVRTRLMQIEIDNEKAARGVALREKGLTETEKTLIVEKSMKAERDITNRYLADIAKSRNEYLEGVKDSVARAEQFIAAEQDKAEQQRDQALQSRLIRFQQEADAAEIIATGQYRAGLISEEEYQRQKALIQAKYTGDSYDDMVRFYLEELKLSGDNLEKQKEIGKKLDDLDKKKRENQQTTIDLQKQHTQEVIDTAVQLGQASADLFNEIMGFAADAANRQIEELDALIERIESAAEREKAMIEETSLGEAEKARLTKKLDADVQANREQIEARQRQLRRQAAQAEKAANISAAISNTAVAVVSALKTQPVWLGIAMAALVGALGAAQIARIVATPLPQYAKGRKGGKAEYAIVGEAGAERIEYTDGSSKIVNNAQIEYLPAGAKVISNPELEREKLESVARSSMHVTSSGQLVDQRAAKLDDLKRSIDQQTEAIKRSKTDIHVHRSWMGERFSIQTAQGFSKWINDNI